MLRFLVVGLLFFVSLPAYAWTYLEHSYFTDKACQETKESLGELIASYDPKDPKARDILLPRYLAMAILCPKSQATPYCKKKKKEVSAYINERTHKNDHPLTLGDFSALADHFSQFGKIQGFPRLEKEGLITAFLGWLAPEAGHPDHGVGQIARKGCLVSKRVKWKELEAERRALHDFTQTPIPPKVLTSSLRAPLPLGLKEPTTAFSITNPHYLDLVLFNQHHFGKEAYATWLGFHSVAQNITLHRCEKLIKPTKKNYRKLAGAAALIWKKLDKKTQAKTTCELLKQTFATRIVQLAKQGTQTERDLLAPYLRNGVPSNRLASQTTVQSLSLIFEAIGIHFLQDTLSGGHVRVNRNAYSLALSRYHHDTDGRNGVITSIGTLNGNASFLAFGDSYLLLDPEPEKPPSRCKWGEITSPSLRTACLLRWQRQLVINTTSASLMDWSLGGNAVYIAHGL